MTSHGGGTTVSGRNPWGAAWNLFRAEWLKVAGNRWVAIGLVWIFPIVATLFMALLALILALDSGARANFGVEETYQWTDLAVGVWNIPNHPFLRVILLGFTAVVFAGEYQWQTWKNTIPRNNRVALIVAKFVTVGLFVMLVFVLTSILVAVGFGFLLWISGHSYGPALTTDVLTDFLQDYAVQASTAFTTTIISAGYAALAGMFTRSILGGVITGFILTVAESVSFIGLMLVGWFLDIPRIVELFRFAPLYNVLNVLSWINESVPGEMTFYEDDPANLITLSDSLSFSLIVLAAWVVGIIALTAFLFHRQDITS